ncbi:hypothetical protein SAMN06295945_1581 [Polynucleobacter meluiroseus]|uniref:Uncharacterized protein n=1 Tax=Polynucleobacter meluiroseus TaxID=1938814 RepID=A0A240E196_9BURK|nr:hypothetical protein SAMN06295945_1581 [Polynucleobacter meluiroseus]
MSQIKLSVKFFKTELGLEPVRDWLKDLEQADKKTIGKANEDKIYRNKF